MECCHAFLGKANDRNNDFEIKSRCYQDVHNTANNNFEWKALAIEIVK